MPVAVAGAIGFGNSFSGITGGLSAVANGPGTTSTTTTTTAAPRRLDDAVVALADPAPAGGADGVRGDVGGGADGDIGTTNTGGGGSGGGGGSTQPGGAGAAGVPEVLLPPGGGGGGGSGDPVGDVLNGVNDAVNGLLGGGSP